MHLHLFSSVIRRAQHLLFHSVDSLFSSVRRGVSGLTVLCSAFPYLQSCRHHVGSRWAVRCLNNHCFAAVLHIRFLTILKKLELSLLLVFTECQNKIQRILYESRSIKSYVFLLVGLCLIECYSFETLLQFDMSIQVCWALVAKFLTVNANQIRGGGHGGFVC